MYGKKLEHEKKHSKKVFLKPDHGVNRTPVGNNEYTGGPGGPGTGFCGLGGGLVVINAVASYYVY